MRLATAVRFKCRFDWCRNRGCSRRRGRARPYPIRQPSARKPAPVAEAANSVPRCSDRTAVRGGFARASVLFVYGTLREFSAIPMARRLRCEATALGAARVAGRLYDLGSYPGLTRSHRREEWVIGELYRLRSAHRTLRVLDRYEARFVRERVIVRIASGRTRRAWVYRFRGPVRARNRIASGDYLAHRLRPGASRALEPGEHDDPVSFGRAATLVRRRAPLPPRTPGATTHGRGPCRL